MGDVVSWAQNQERIFDTFNKDNEILIELSLVEKALEYLLEYRLEENVDFKYIIWFTLFNGYEKLVPFRFKDFRIAVMFKLCFGGVI